MKKVISIITAIVDLLICSNNMFHELWRENIEGKLVIGSDYLELLVEWIALHLNFVLAHAEKFCRTADDTREKTIFFAW